MKALAFLVVISLINLFLAISQKSIELEQISENNFDNEKDNEKKEEQYIQKENTKGEASITQINHNFLNILFNQNSFSKTPNAEESSASAKYIWKTVLFIGIVVIFY